MRRLLTLTILLSGLLPLAAVTASRAATTTDVAIVSADIRTGQRLAGACYVIVDWSNEGCDENGDGQVDFTGVARGDYTVTQTRPPAGYLAPGDFPIAVDDDGSGLFAAFLIPKANGDGNFDIAVGPIDAFTDESLTGACFVLNGGSIEGCDENEDGRVDYQDVRAGTYLVTETRAPIGYSVPDDFWIAVTAKGAKRFLVRQTEDTGLPDVSIVSIDDQTGERVVGACYVIVDWSNEGCDENGDGQVDFRDVRPGTYAVKQTKAPAGFETGADFSITVRDVPRQSFAAHLDPAPAGRDVAIVSRDAETGNRLVGACYIIDSASIEGCDENNDGQVDFKDVRPGTFDVIETKAPKGYAAVVGLKITVKASGDGSIQLFAVNHRRS
ncbi:MAG TPA: SpaA isopeptide-forming pilin-related protein [Thermomicrobiales bacterium]|jgi:uncharacterized surface anchored protein